MLVLAAVIPILYLIVSNKKPKVFLNAQEWQELKLTEKEVLPHPLNLPSVLCMPYADMTLTAMLIINILILGIVGYGI